jgi:hypothetical protein
MIDMSMPPEMKPELSGSHIMEVTISLWCLRSRDNVPV